MKKIKVGAKYSLYLVLLILLEMSVFEYITSWSLVMVQMGVPSGIGAWLIFMFLIKFLIKENMASEYFLLIYCLLAAIVTYYLAVNFH